jgi:hypothetical protein
VHANIPQKPSCLTSLWISFKHAWRLSSHSLSYVVCNACTHTLSTHVIAAAHWPEDGVADVHALTAHFIVRIHHTLLAVVAVQCRARIRTYARVTRCVHAYRPHSACCIVRVVAD